MMLTELVCRSTLARWGEQESQNMRRATHTNSNEPRRCISYMIMGRGALR